MTTKSRSRRRRSTKSARQALTSSAQKPDAYMCSFVESSPLISITTGAGPSVVAGAAEK